MPEIFIDTSVWVARLHGSIPLGPARLGDQELVASTLILGEAASLVEQGRLVPESMALLLDSVRLEAPSPEDLVAAGRLHGKLRRAGNRKVSLIDCIMHQTAVRLGRPFVTRDRDLVGQAGVHLI